MKPKIAIIGAGISGLTLARTLSPYADIQVFEKARGVGGRMSTRYAEPFYFDHGTQFFTARSQDFQRYLSPLIAKGLVAEWTGKVITFQEDRTIKDRLWFEPHYVAVPNMNSLCKYLAIDIPVTLNTEVASLGEKLPDGWQLADKDGNSLGVYDWVVSTAPPVQTKRLFSAHLPPQNPLSNAILLGCYTLMIGFNKSWTGPWIAAKVHASPIEWIAINSTKPGRNHSVTSIIVHSHNSWAEMHIDDDIHDTEAFLRREFDHITGIDSRTADYFSCHRWRYALVDQPKERTPFIDSDLGLASTGDWCNASRIEDTWLNAIKLGNHFQQFL
jgi:hypothetical protein